MISDSSICLLNSFAVSKRFVWTISKKKTLDHQRTDDPVHMCRFHQVLLQTMLLLRIRHRFLMSLCSCVCFSNSRTCVFPMLFVSSSQLVRYSSVLCDICALALRKARTHVNRSSRRRTKTGEQTTCTSSRCDPVRRSTGLPTLSLPSCHITANLCVMSRSVHVPFLYSRIFSNLSVWPLTPL